MDLWTNLILAWVSVVLAVLLALKYGLRKGASRKDKFGKLMKKINKHFTHSHKYLGALLVLTGLVHGLFSTQKVWSFNLGTIAWIVSILLGVNWMARKYLSKLKGWIFYHRMLTVVFAGIIVWHVIDVGGIRIDDMLTVNSSAQVNTVQTTAAKAAAASQMKNNTYKDGTYEGEATGYRDGLKVSVTIKSNKITNVVVTSHNEVNERFYGTPVAEIPKEIVAAQNTAVDTISGATFTSVGIINAVNNALSKAIVSGSVPDTQQLPQNRGHGGHGKRGERDGSDGPDGNFSGHDGSFDGRPDDSEDSNSN